jgi:hypothetical protein
VPANHSPTRWPGRSFPVLSAKVTIPTSRS